MIEGKTYDWKYLSISGVYGKPEVTSVCVLVDVMCNDTFDSSVDVNIEAEYTMVSSLIGDSERISEEESVMLKFCVPEIEDEINERIHFLDCMGLLL